MKGLELASVWQPDSHWSLNASLVLLDATYTSFTNVDVLNPAAGVQNLAGKYLNNAPKETANLGVAYRTSEFPLGRLTFRADASIRSTTYFREFNSPNDSQSGYSVVNLGLIWDSPSDRYRARVFSTNATNQAYITTLFPLQTEGANVVSWGNPRQVGVEFTANF